MNIFKKAYQACRNIPDVPGVDYTKHRKIFFGIPIVLLTISLAFALILGVNLDVKFKGGTIIDIPYSGDADLSLAQQTAASSLGHDCTVQDGENGTQKQLVITLSENTDVSPDQVSALLGAMNQAMPDQVTTTDSTQVSVTTVDPSVGMDFFYKCLIAVGIAFIAIIIYIGIRFRRIGGVSAGLMGIVSLLHDVAFVFAAMVFFRFPINDAFMAVVLTILGYSINNTIVIFDRIRENRGMMESQQSIKDVVNLSINQTLARSINTTVTTLLALSVMLIVGLICHIDTIVAFVVPMMIGMLAGIYSSIFISGPLWVLWKEKHPDHATKALAGVSEPGVSNEPEAEQPTEQPVADDEKKSVSQAQAKQAKKPKQLKKPSQPEETEETKQPVNINIEMNQNQLHITQTGANGEKIERTVSNLSELSGGIRIGGEPVEPIEPTEPLEPDEIEVRTSFHINPKALEAVEKEVEIQHAKARERDLQEQRAKEEKLAKKLARQEKKAAKSKKKKEKPDDKASKPKSDSDDSKKPDEKE